jgi:hypothetical protein
MPIFEWLSEIMLGRPLCLVGEKLLRGGCRKELLKLIVSGVVSVGGKCVKYESADGLLIIGLMTPTPLAYPSSLTAV